MSTSDKKHNEQDSTPFPTKDDHPKSAEQPSLDQKKKKSSEEDLLDEGLSETFPASDPVSISTKKTKG